jgi:hypothetical protein
LCATELAGRFSSQQLDVTGLIETFVKPHVDNDSWHEVVRLLIGLLPAPAAEQVLLSILPELSDLIAPHDPNAEERPSGRENAALLRLQLAWQGLAEIEPRRIPLLQTLCLRLSDLVFIWLAHGTYGTPAAAIAESVSSIGPTAWPVPHPPDLAWPMPSARLASEQASLICAFGKSIWGCPEATFLFMMSACIGSEYRVSDAIYALGEHFSDDPRTFPLLCAIATDVNNYPSDRAAVLALERQYPADDRLVPIFRMQAILTTDPVWRDKVVEMLAQHFRDHMLTRPLLRAMITFGKGFGNAAHTLAEYFRDDPATKSLLRDRAKNDPRSAFRSSALLALEKYFHDDPQTLLLLQERVLNEPHEACRILALRALAKRAEQDPDIAAFVRNQDIEEKDNAGVLIFSDGNFDDEPEDPEDAAKALDAVRARALNHPHSESRRIATLECAHRLGVPYAPVLMSCDLNGKDPGRDLLEPIGGKDITSAAQALGMTEHEVRTIYERIAEELPIVFALNH